MRNGSAFLITSSLATVAAVVLVAASPGDSAATSRGAGGLDHTDQILSFTKPPGQSPHRLYGRGGLVVRAACERYDHGRQFLWVSARSKVRGAARASGLSFANTTRSFSGNDFGPAYGWYDMIGSIEGSERGTFVFSRPDGGQVTLSFAADVTGCSFEGLASWIP
jgi:hypothetical protein